VEHRYYGKSFPYSDISTEHLRFLTTDQALADTAYFAKNAKFAGIKENLASPNAPWIIYGGSYAGGFVVSCDFKFMVKNCALDFMEQHGKLLLTTVSFVTIRPCLISLCLVGLSMGNPKDPCPFIKKPGR